MLLNVGCLWIVLGGHIARMPCIMAYKTQQPWEGPHVWEIGFLYKTILGISNWNYYDQYLMEMRLNMYFFNNKFYLKFWWYLMRTACWWDGENIPVGQMLATEVENSKEMPRVTWVWEAL